MTLYLLYSLAFIGGCWVINQLVRFSKRYQKLHEEFNYLKDRTSSYCSSDVKWLEKRIERIESKQKEK